MKSVIRWMLNVVFSPPRCNYDPDNTASAITTESGNVYIRRNHNFKTKQNMEIFGSLWYDQANERPSSCMIYLHSLGANQFEVINIVPLLCTEDFAVYSFDFPGCGMSEGDYIPLDGSGTDLVEYCVRSLREEFGIQQFALWGRSMGAAIALHSVSVLDTEFCCVVSDSSFSCTKDVMADQTKINGYPSFLIKLLMPVIKKEAQEGLHTNVDNPFPIHYIPFARVPLLIGHGSRDKFVSTWMAEEIFKKYGYDDKQLYFFNGNHNSARPSQWYQTAARFIYKHANINMRARPYELVYRTSSIHVGPVDQVVSEINEMKRLEHQLEHMHEDQGQNEQNEEEDREVNNREAIKAAPSKEEIILNDEKITIITNFKPIEMIENNQNKSTRKKVKVKKRKKHHHRKGHHSRHHHHHHNNEDEICFQHEEHAERKTSSEEDSGGYNDAEISSS